jgi:beta-lactamase class A
MASVFKIPILATAGLQLAQGKIDLNTRVALRDEDKSTGSGILPFFEVGVSPTIRDLLTLMIIISDNTATDMNVELLGGAQVVEDTMHQLGLTDIYFKMNCKQLLKSLYPPEIRDLSVEDLHAWSNEHGILYDGTAFSLKPDNNVSTALAMTRLIRMLFQGEIVRDEAKDEMMGIMYKQQLNQRLPRFLPPGVAFAHKTGTIGGVCNDAGVMTVAEDKHVVVTLFTKWGAQAVWNEPVARTQRVFEVESAMGRIGRLVYDHYSS